MNSARTVLSPVKENQQNTGRGSPFKGQKSHLNQILTYLKQNGIKLPSHLHPHKNPEEFSLKLNPVEGSSKSINEVKSLKIKLCDTQFELKKMQEDFAQYKRAVKAQKEKQQRKFEQALQRLKQDSKQNNEDYDFTLQKKAKQHNAQIEKLRTQYSQKLEKLEKQLTLKHSAQLSRIQHKTANEKESHEIQFNKKYSNLHKELTEEMQNLKKQHDREKYNITQRNNERFQQMKKNFESTILALQSEKKTEEKLHEKTKQDAQRQKEKIFGELCYEKNVRKNLEDELAAKNKEIKELQERIQQLNIQLEITKENAEQEKSWMRSEQQKQVDHIHEQYQEKIRKILNSHTEACQKYQSRIQKLNQFHQKSQLLHEAKLQQLSLKFEQRLSKPEDLEQIKKLTEAIVKRDEQIRKLTRDLRYRNLQIQNKEQVYNKIFKSSTKMRQERKVVCSINKCEYPTMPKLERDSWSKQSLFRKSQTADVKALLKSICKTKRQHTIHKDQ